MTFLFDPPSAPEFHLSEEFLLLEIHGELSPAQTSLLKEHLDHCPNCQAKCDLISRTTLEIAERRKRIENQIGPLSPASRDRFIRGLDDLLLEPPSGRRGRNPVQPQWGFQFIAQIAPFLSAALIAICAYVILISIWHGRRPNVSAAEFLNRAAASEQSSSSSSAADAIPRKFLFKTANRTIEHNIYRDLTGRGRPTKGTPVDVENAELAIRLALAGVNWDDPLSAVSFKSWHDRQVNPEDEIQPSGAGTLTLSTRLASTPIARESLTVRVGDFHPTRRVVEFRDSGKVEISEASPEVLSLGEPDRVLPLPPPEPPVPMPASPNPAFVPLPTRMQRNETELEARLMLNQQSADTGEQIEIKQDAKGVNVQGLVDSEERKKELEAALQAIPYLSVSIRSVEDLKSTGGALAKDAKGLQRMAVAQISPLEHYFLQQGRSRDDLSRISAGLFNCSLAASRSSRAIERIGLQFSADENLSPAAIRMRDELLSRIGERLLVDLDQQKQFLDEADLKFDWASVGSLDSHTDNIELAHLADLNMAATTALISGTEKSPDSQKALATELAKTILQLRTAALTIIPGLSSK